MFPMSCHNVLYVFITTTLYFHFATSNNSTPLYPITDCPVGLPINVDILSYELPADSWDSNTNNVCPKSDSNIPQWLTLFQDPQHNTIPGSFTIRTDDGPVDSSVACNKNGELIIQSKAEYQGKTGQLHFTFTSENGSYSTNFTIRYASTGVYPDDNTVYFREGHQYAVLNWYIYHSEVNTYKLYYNGTPIQDTDVMIQLDLSKYSTFENDYENCVKSSSGDTTLFYSLFVKKPTAATSAGEYVLAMDSYSATVTLAVNPTPITNPPSPSSNTPSITSSKASSSSLLTTTPSPSTHDINPSASLITDSVSSTSTPVHHRPLPCPTSAPDNGRSVTTSSTTEFRVVTVPTNRASSSSNIDKTGLQIVLPVVLGLLVILVILSVILFAIVYYFKYKRNNQQDDQVEKGSRQHSSTGSFIQRQFSQDPSLYKYHIPSVAARNDTIVIELNDINSPPNTTRQISNDSFSFTGQKEGGSVSSSLRSKESINVTMATPPHSDIRTEVLKAPRPVGRSLSVETGGKVVNKQSTPPMMVAQHRRVGYLRGGHHDMVSKSLPTSHELMTLLPQGDPPITALSSSYSTLVQEKEKMRLLKLLKRRIDPKMSTKVMETATGGEDERVALMKGGGGERCGGQDPISIGFCNKMSIEVDDSDVFQIELDPPTNDSDGLGRGGDLKNE